MWSKVNISEWTARRKGTLSEVRQPVEDIINNNYDHDKWMKEFTTNQIALALGYSEELIRLRLK